MSLVIKFDAGLRPVVKHQQHDQKTHGNWATGISSELENWNPKDPIPRGPRNAGGVTERFWDNWEHGVDGDQFVDLYRQYAGEMLGLPVPKSDKDVGGSEHYLTQPGFGASSTATVRKQTEAVLLDIYQNPIKVDIESFYDEVLSRYFEVTNDYYAEYEKLRKSRKVHKVLDLNEEGK